MKHSRLCCALLILVLLAALLAPAVWADLAVERQVFDYLTGTMGLNSAAACGILANIEAESGFRLEIQGDSGSSYGLCQWHNSRYDALVSFCSQQGLDYRTVDGQMAYLSLELRTYFPNTLNILRNVPDTVEGAYTAAYYWCVNFEAPANAELSAAHRGTTAQTKYWIRYGGTTGSGWTPSYGISPSSGFDSKGYSGLLWSGGLGEYSFYWESGSSSGTSVSYSTPDAANPAPVNRTESAQRPSEGRGEPGPAPTFRYIPHHFASSAAARLAPEPSPLCTLFWTGGPTRKRMELPLPEEVPEETPV